MEDLYMQTELDDQSRVQNYMREQCITSHGSSVLQDVLKPVHNNSTQDSLCPAFWDGILCWPDTPPGTLATQICPSFVRGFTRPNDNATRMCTGSGVWFLNSFQNATWTNYTECYNISDGDSTTIYVSTKYEIPKILQESVPIIAIISKIGYTVSLTSLVIAFAIMLSIKKLHCTRNILHMHLFASFILRALVNIIKSQLFIENVGFEKDVHDQYFHINYQTTNWECKLLTSLVQYSITANYSWILMEGLYLHNLIFRALFADSNNNIRLYVILGWGCPLIIVSTWVFVKIKFENSLCWTQHDDYRVFLIIALPTMISILINLVFFIRISRVLYSKLRTPMSEDSRRYRKWVKSTLVLVPLFGVHYAVFLYLYFLIKLSTIIELIWLICETVFGTFQGFFVAVLYCFMNGEVKAEIKPRFFRFFTFLATNKYSKMCFPCRKKFLRSIVGRSSVCTTMSCSSLYTNGIHRNSKTRLDSLPKTKHSGQLEKINCHNGLRSLQDLSTKRNLKSHQGKSQCDLHNPTTKTTSETTLCLEPVVNQTVDKNSAPDFSEETMKMVQKNNF